MAESAVVAYPHDLYGDGIFAYITLKMYGGSETEAELFADLKALVKSKIAAYAMPHLFLVCYYSCIIVSNNKN